VTAQKREQRLQDVPISIEVLQGDALADFGASDLRDVTTLVPNFYFQPSPGNDALYIRGFGSAGANFGFDQSVSLYQDGVYAGRARQFMGPFFDVERVEVLRGPQGALLGKNTAAGAVSIVTANPTNTFEGSARALYNFTREGFDVSGHVSGPIGDDFGVRLAVKHTAMGGYVHNVTTGKDEPDLNNTLGRLTLRYEPSNTFDVTAKLEYGRFRTEGDSGRSSALAAPLPDTKTDRNIFGFPTLDKQTAFNGGLTANIGVGTHVLTSVTGYSDLTAYRGVNAANEANAIFHNQYFEDFSQFSQELRLASPTGQLIEYIAGVYYDRADLSLLSPTYYDIAALGVAGRLDVDFRQRTETWSGFASATINVSPDFRISGSARYTHINKLGSFDERLVSGTTHPAVGGPRSFSKALKENYFDPSATLQYDVTDDVMLFATFARGSKGAGYAAAIRTTTPATFTVLGERSTNYEAGIRSTWFDRVLTVNLTAYNTEFKDLQVSAYSAAIANTIISNAARARSRGVEGTIIIAPSRAFQLSSSFAYTDAKYLEYPGAPCTALQPTPPCTPATNNQDGYDLLSTPRWSGNVRADYSTPLGDALKLSASGVMTFRSRYYVATDYSAVYGIQKGWAKFDARIQLSADDEKWSLALIGTNLTDRQTVPFAYAFPAIFSSTGTHLVRFVDEPRTVSVEASLRF
jgi:iron complex outermembrane receptor protein